MATTGTHDTSSLVEWWEDELTADQRTAGARCRPSPRCASTAIALTPEGRAVLLGGVYGAASRW